MKSLFVAVLVIVAGSIFLMSRGEFQPAASATAQTAPAAAATADQKRTGVADAKADTTSIQQEAATPTKDSSANDNNDLHVPMIASDAERAETLVARQESLPVFLRVADESIARTTSELETARLRGAPVEEVAAIEEKLRAMQSARAGVLARNNDIRS